MQLDDLYGFKEASRTFGKAHHEDCTQTKIRGHNDATFRRGEPGAQLSEAGVIKSSGTHYAMNVVCYQKFEVFHHRVGVGEINHYVSLSSSESIE